jgi:hypothetical protein
MAVLSKTQVNLKLIPGERHACRMRAPMANALFRPEVLRQLEPLRLVVRADAFAVE